VAGHLLIVGRRKGEDNVGSAEIELVRSGPQGLPFHRVFSDEDIRLGRYDRGIWRLLLKPLRNNSTADEQAVGLLVRAERL